MDIRDWEEKAKENYTQQHGVSADQITIGHDMSSYYTYVIKKNF